MKDLCVIPCGRKKIWDDYPNAGAVPAGRAYTGTLHKKSRQYAEVFCTDVRILSAKYGFLSFEDIVEENYDLSFHFPKSKIITGKELKQQAETQGLLLYDKVTVLAGRKYRPFLKEVFPDRVLHYPLEDYKGIGYILQALQEAVETTTPLPPHR